MNNKFFNELLNSNLNESQVKIIVTSVCLSMPNVKKTCEYEIDIALYPIELKKKISDILVIVGKPKAIDGRSIKIISELGLYLFTNYYTEELFNKSARDLKKLSLGMYKDRIGIPQ
jgi:hypothetical protein